MRSSQASPLLRLKSLCQGHPLPSSSSFLLAADTCGVWAQPAALWAAVYDTGSSGLSLGPAAPCIAPSSAPAEPPSPGRNPASTQGHLLWPALQGTLAWKSFWVMLEAYGGRGLPPVLTGPTKDPQSQGLPPGSSPSLLLL